MKKIMWTLQFLLLLLSGKCILQECKNGVFKCVSPTTLRMCINGRLLPLGPELPCPKATYCNEMSYTICTRRPAPTVSNPESIEDLNSSESKYDAKYWPLNFCDENQSIFPIEDTGCAFYVNCTKDNILTEDLTCDSESLFDPINKCCSQEYECPEIQQHLESTFECIPSDAVHVCTKEGRFSVPNTGCTTYVKCKRKDYGFKAELDTCNTGKLFDPTMGKCTQEYICKEIPCSITNETTSSSTTTTTTKSPSTEDLPKCTQSGRIPIPNTNCKFYRLCSVTTTGFVYQDVKCPSGYFDPEKKRCSISYNCPEGNATASTSTTQIPTKSTTPEMIGSPTLTPTNAPITKSTIATTENITTNDSTNTDDPITNLSPNTTTSTSNNNITDEPSQSPTDNPVTDLNSDTTSSATEKNITAETISTPTVGFATDPNQNTDKTFTDKLSTTSRDNIITNPNSNSSTTTPEPSPTFTENPGTDPNSDTSSTTDRNFTVETISTTTNNTITDSNPDTSTAKNSDTSSTTDRNFTVEPISTTTNNTITDSNPDTSTAKNFTDIPGLSTTTNSITDPNPDTTSTTHKNITDEIISTSTYNSITDLNQETTSNSDKSVTPDTTSATEKVIVKPRCEKQGKISVANSNCKFYVDCILTTSGYLDSMFECPNGSLFDPLLKKCSKFYICTESENKWTTISAVTTISTTTVNASPIVPVCKVQGNYAVINTNCKKYLSCILTTSGYKATEYECSKGMFDPKLQKCTESYVCIEKPTFDLPQITNNSEISECKEKGKFSINNSGCRKYILCTLTTTGFKSKIYTCPANYLFNPETKRCDINCKCSEKSNTINLTSDEQTTIRNSDSEIVTVDNTIDKSSTGVSNNNSDKCDNSIIVIPECVSKGRLAIIGTNCKKYLLCTHTTAGFKSKVYECLSKSNFDPNKNICSVTYQCNECGGSGTEITPTTEIIPTTTIGQPQIPECLTQGRFPISGSYCVQYVLCISTKNGYASEIYNCPIDSFYDPQLQRCSKNYICNENIRKNRSSSSFNCSTIGKFSDPNDPLCEYYYNCEEITPDLITGRLQKCELNYTFDPQEQMCLDSYICPNKTKKLVRVRRSNITPTFLVNGRCTTVGRFAVPETNCRNYIYCSVNADGILNQSSFSCPTTTVFNQAIQKCTSAYICPDSVCYFPGPRPNPNDSFCISYIECELVVNSITGIITGYKGQVQYCPTGMLFDPMALYCTYYYVCPTK